MQRSTSVPTTGSGTEAAPKRRASGRRSFHDLGLRVRIFAIVAVLFLGIAVVTGTAMRGSSNVDARQQDWNRAVAAQQQVERGRYQLLWLANWQNITAWKSRTDGGATAAAVDGDNLKNYDDGVKGFEAEIFGLDPDDLNPEGKAAVAHIQSQWQEFLGYNDQIFTLWRDGKLDRGDKVSGGPKWDIFFEIATTLDKLRAAVDEQVVASKANIEDTRAATQRMTIIVALLALLLGALLAWRVSGRLVSDLLRVRAGLLDVAAGDLSTRVPVSSRDEAGQMAGALNTAVENMATVVSGIRRTADTLASSAV